MTDTPRFETDKNYEYDHPRKTYKITLQAWEREDKEERLCAVWKR